MRLIVFAAMLIVLGTLVPLPAAAHQCGSNSASSDCICPPPSDGQAHQHAYPGGSCQAFAGASQSATPGGASQTPGAGLALLVGAFAVVALVRSRRA